MPLESSFKYIMKTDVRGLDLFLCISCMVDIGLNFRTGYCVQMEYIEMKPGAIAKLSSWVVWRRLRICFRNYVCGIYFICDVISSIPELKLHDQALEIVEYIDYCSMFKIVRIGTCLEYVKRTLIVREWFWSVEALHFDFSTSKREDSSFLWRNWQCCCFLSLTMLVAFCSSCRSYLNTSSHIKEQGNRKDFGTSSTIPSQILYLLICRTASSVPPSF